MCGCEDFNSKTAVSGNNKISGMRFNWSQLGYTAIGAVVAKASNVAVSSFMRDKSTEDKKKAEMIFGGVKILVAGAVIGASENPIVSNIALGVVAVGTIEVFDNVPALAPLMSIDGTEMDFDALPVGGDLALIEEYENGGVAEPYDDVEVLEDGVAGSGMIF